MILAEVRDYIEQHGHATLDDLARRFDAHPEALRAMLEILVRKQRVRLVTPFGCGTTCRTCPPEARDVYVWAGGEDGA